MKTTILIFTTAISMAYTSRFPNDIKLEMCLFDQLSSSELRMTGIPRIEMALEVSPCNVDHLFSQERNALDPRLVGFWSKTKYYNSGGFSYVNIQRFSLDTDGSMTIYEPISYASGGGTYMGPSSSLQIDTVVKVHTRGNRLYVSIRRTPS